MFVTTEHQFLDQYPIKQNSKYLIIGTIHPHKVEEFKLPFFYGNKGTFWSILSDAFPHRNFSSVEHIKKVLDETQTSITDMIRRCDRKDENVTQDKELFNICLNTNQIQEGIVNSSISTIFLTSGFQKNNAAKLLVENFRIAYKATWNNVDRSFVIPKQIFGRAIKAVVLFSPSGQANVGISNSPSYKAKRDLYLDQKTPVKQFKIDFYRDTFAYMN